MDNLIIGLQGETKTVVNDNNTAKAHGSGSLMVLATPAMIALMENAAMNSVQPMLPDGVTTVGIDLKVKHISATPLGMGVVAKSELISQDGKRLVFKVEAFDEKEKIGEGIHERFIVDSVKFMRTNKEKLDK